MRVSHGQNSPLPRAIDGLYGILFRGLLGSLVGVLSMADVVECLEMGVSVIGGPMLGYLYQGSYYFGSVAANYQIAPASHRTASWVGSFWNFMVFSCWKDAHATVEGAYAPSAVVRGFALRARSMKSAADNLKEATSA